jgi:hypothetical protein
MIRNVFFSGNTIQGFHLRRKLNSNFDQHFHVFNHQIKIETAHKNKKKEMNYFSSIISRQLESIFLS